MKRALFASTALVAMTGAAMANGDDDLGVSLSGRAEMGVFKTSSEDFQFFTDIDVTFTMVGETDNGLTFGASVDLDESIGDANDAGAPGESGATRDNSDDGGATIFISGAFGTVTMGDTDGALDWALTDAGNVGNPGSLADDETSHAGYLGSYADGAYDGQILRWDYTWNNFGVAVSIDDDNGTAGVDVGYAIRFKYDLELSGATVALGIGYQSSETLGARTLQGAAIPAGTEIDILGVSAAATFDNGLAAGVEYSDWDIGAASADHIGIGLGYETGPFAVHVNYGKYDIDGGGDSDGFGIAAAYDLGGGAVVHFGYGDGENFNNVDTRTISFGLGLSF